MIPIIPLVFEYNAPCLSAVVPIRLSWMSQLQLYLGLWEDVVANNNPSTADEYKNDPRNPNAKNNKH